MDPRGLSVQRRRLRAMRARRRPCAGTCGPHTRVTTSAHVCQDCHTTRSRHVTIDRRGRCQLAELPLRWRLRTVVILGSASEVAVLRFVLLAAWGQAPLRAVSLAILRSSRSLNEPERAPRGHVSRTSGCGTVTMFSTLSSIVPWFRWGHHVTRVGSSGASVPHDPHDRRPSRTPPQEDPRQDAA